jgi:hypothetical protein
MHFGRAKKRVHGVKSLGSAMMLSMADAIMRARLLRQVLGQCEKVGTLAFKQARMAGSAPS